MTTREGKAEPLQAVAADYAGGIREGNVTPVVIYDQNENVLGVSQPLKYVALVTQTGTDDPVVTEVFNNTGATITITRDAIGVYTVTASSAVFVENKTTVLMTDSVSTASFLQGAYATTTTINLESKDTTGGRDDDLLSNSTLVIEIYP